MNERFMGILVRNHFEKYGDFEQLKEEPWYTDIKALAKHYKIPVTDYPYTLVGIKPTEMFSEKEVFNLKAAVYRDDAITIKRMLKRKGLEGSLQEVLKSQKIEIFDKSLFIRNREYRNLVEVYSTFIRNYKEPLITHGNVKFTLFAYCDGLMRLSKDGPVRTLNDTLFSQAWFEELAQALPKRVDVDNPTLECVYRGELYTPYKEFNHLDLVKDSILNLFVEVGFLSNKLAMLFSSLHQTFGTPQIVSLQLYDQHKSVMPLMTELTLITGKSLKDILNSNGYVHVDFNQTYEEGLIVLPYKNEFVRVLHKSIENSVEFIIISEKDFKILYERNLIGTLHYSPGRFINNGKENTFERMAHIEDDDNIPLYEYVLNSNTDFKGSPNILHPENINHLFTEEDKKNMSNAFDRFKTMFSEG